MFSLYLLFCFYLKLLWPAFHRWFSLRPVSPSVCVCTCQNRPGRGGSRRLEDPLSLPQVAPHLGAAALILLDRSSQWGEGFSLSRLHRRQERVTLAVTNLPLPCRIGGEDGLVIARPSHPLFLWDVTQFAPSVWGHSLQMFLDRGREGTCSSLSAGGWEPGSILCMATCPATDQSFWF